MNYEKDSFEDILAKDRRYNPRAYTVLMDVFLRLSADMENVTSVAIMDEFRETVLDEFGPLSFHVLEEWGVTRCEDLGEMMFNLADSGRLRRSEGDEKECFAGGYDFREEFLLPFEAK